jgi:hypothetical protein
MRAARAVGALGAGMAVAALVFTSGLNRLVSTPASFGTTWQLEVGTNYDEQRDGSSTCTASDRNCGDQKTVLTKRMMFVQQVVADDPGIESATPFAQQMLNINGTKIGVYSMDAGDVQPAIIDGRRPADDEIALGQRLDGSTLTQYPTV